MRRDSNHDCWSVHHWEVRARHQWWQALAMELQAKSNYLKLSRPKQGEAEDSMCSLKYSSSSSNDERRQAVKNGDGEWRAGSESWAQRRFLIEVPTAQSSRSPPRGQRPLMLRKDGPKVAVMTSGPRLFQATHHRNLLHSVSVSSLSPRRTLIPRLRRVYATLSMTSLWRPRDWREERDPSASPILFDLLEAVTIFLRSPIHLARAPLSPLRWACVHF